MFGPEPENLARIALFYHAQIAALASGEVAAPPRSWSATVGQMDQMVVLASVCSSRIIVDARKRTALERPDAPASDVRLVQRPRASVYSSVYGTVPGSVVHQPKTLPAPPQLPPLWADEAGRARLAMWDAKQARIAAPFWDAKKASIAKPTHK